MKHNYLYLLLALCVGAVVMSCKPKNDPDTEERYTLRELEDYNYSHVTIKKVTDYLYEVNNDNYFTNYYYNPFSSGTEFNGVKEWHGACAAVRNGNFFGRNLDWSCSHQPEFVVRTPAKDGKHATMGICATGMIRKQPQENWLSQMLVNDITMATYDGINDAGVCMVVLVVHHADDTPTTGTNPSASVNLHGSNVVRYVLDNASSAAEGIELLQRVNIYGSLEDYTFHWLLCDEHENYFVEIINNSVVACRCDQNTVNTQFSKPVITNFYMLKPYADQKVPGGDERFKLLANDYNNTADAKGMFAALENIRFSRKYEGRNPADLKPTEPDLNWYSEYYESAPNYEDYSLPAHHYNKDSLHQSMWNHCMKWDIIRNSLNMLYAKGADPRDNALSSWTCHTSVYNIPERSMQVVIGEKYSNVLPSAITSFHLK